MLLFAVTDLRVGDEVYREDGNYSVVEAISFVYRRQGMYNLTVEGAHTYFVGDGQWLVHNDCEHTDPVIWRSRGAIATRQHIDPVNLGEDGVSAWCKDCTANSGKFWERTGTEIRAFASELGLDPNKTVRYTPQFGGNGHYSLFVDALGRMAICCHSTLMPLIRSCVAA